MNLKHILKARSYRAGNTFRLRYNNQLVNAVYRIIIPTLCYKNDVTKHTKTLWEERTIFFMLNLMVINTH